MSIYVNTILKPPLNSALSASFLSSILLIVLMPVMGHSSDKAGRKPLPTGKPRGKTIGIVGLGRIGRQAGELADVFGTKSIAFSPNTPHSEWSAIEAGRVRMQCTAEKIRAFVRGFPINVVNESRLPKNVGTWRARTGTRTHRWSGNKFPGHQEAPNPWIL